MGEWGGGGGGGGFHPPEDPLPDGEEWLTEYYDDEYMDPHAQLSQEELEEFYAQHGHPGQGGLDPRSLEEIVEHCLEPTVSGAAAHVGKLLFWCLVFRVATQSARIPPWLSHFISAATGMVALAHFFYAAVAYLIVLAVVSYLALALSWRWTERMCGAVVTATCLAINTVW